MQTLSAEKANSIAKQATFSRIETLNTRDSDELDFHNMAAWELRDMLNLAFEQGKQAAS